MKKKLNNILLIDDSEADNFIHKRVIKKAEVAEKITIKYSGQDALDYLVESIDGKYPKPDLVFLDINMPGMDGWEFLDHYDLLPEEKKAGIVVCMLTTSVASRDKIIADSKPIINEFSNKPLTKEMLFNIIEKHFPERV